ncbi:Fc.00g013780.m01.CDS01 [Cosmosporella sp. VM-42]
MFGNFPAFATVPAQVKIDPKDIPPPTPITLPRYQPFAKDDDPVQPSESLPSLLQHTGRSPAILGRLGISAVGLNLNLDAKPEDIIPDPSYIPNFDQWDKLSLDEAREQNHDTRNPLRNGNSSPGCQTYIERKNELSTPNEDAFRTVRRIQPPKGKQQPRLGNTYEFFRCLESFTSFWDDPTQPPQLPPSPEITSPEELNSPSETKPEDAKKDDGPTVLRTASGSSMPADYRNSLISAFIKLVAYDFGCNVSPSRVEPRLHLRSPEGSRDPRKTYCPSGCTFVFQSPMTREAARAGMVYGPLAAVSARGTTDFLTPDMETAQALDLAREIIAGLITAQHRAREGKTEMRFGDGQWWTKEKRWGGGPGGPIGREVEKDAVQGDKDAKPTDEDGIQRPLSKKPRKNMSIYDNYRMIRPPASTWDRKAYYAAIGKPKGTDYDDIFVISSLFHHISILRVRVPNRLLEVLQGSRDQDLTKRSWGKVEAWRSPWYDLFEAEQRVTALKLLWGVMAYQMRKDTGGEDGDVKMSGA